MANYPVPTAGMFVVRPPGQHPTRKVRVLTELLIECFGYLVRTRTLPNMMVAR